MPVKGILERLADGPVVGDGGVCMTLEKRGYCTAGVWTPEAVVLYPEAVRQLLREYARAGADVIQTPCYYSSDGKLKATHREGAREFSVKELNDAACAMARQVADESGAVVCGSLSPVMSYWKKESIDVIKKEYANQLQPFLDNDVDFILAETFGFVEDLEICVSVIKSKTNKPVACNMRIGVAGDEKGHSLEECAVRMAKTGADIIGLNCNFDLNSTLKAMRKVISALEKENLKPYLMLQPLGWMAPETENEVLGYLALPDYAISMDSRSMTRTEVHKFTREAYAMGVRYIGGCCGFEPHHIRAIAQELAEERGREPPVSEMCPAHGARMGSSGVNTNRDKVTKEFWYAVNVASGRPQCSPTNEIIKHGGHK